MQVKNTASVIVRVLLVVASFAYLCSVFIYVAETDIPADTPLPTSSYGDRLYDRPDPDGRASNLRILGVTHTLRAFSLDREHILDRLREADIVLLERAQGCDSPSVGEGVPTQQDYFLQVAAWAIKHGKTAFFIDTRECAVSMTVLFLGVANPFVVLIGTSLIAFGKRRILKLARLLCAFALLIGLISFPNIPLLVGRGLRLNDEALIRLVGFLDYSPASDGFSVQLIERATAIAHAHPNKRVVAVVGNFHAVVAGYYNWHPSIARFKRSVAGFLPNYWTAPVTEVEATGTAGKFLWHVPRQPDASALPE